MRKAKVYFLGSFAGIFEEIEKNKLYKFVYADNYSGKPISLTMPIAKSMYQFKEFPPFFDGLLPEGIMLDGLVRRLKIDKNDLFSQLMAVGHDMVGAVTIEEIK
ncbi:toxin HipA [candidate division WOR-1 bacterium RIFOXYC2_FULL_37_10]|uniref:Toxin HipA n=1 Tax=candidate division WOR-1 bacterium RIFOXYB2_FULL_37_13 TaxID=1802579 RepID=A0A1F4SF85_UNCSA|nr:MAG: toxin HipA [candidate division WOR-1 bacterium RIFOXYA2_FULL_37_7]OGC19067.1 MAG: toxin HipA [candidate division WOR-1 bacterium RIFOXYB2_FULL_37_13]OGC37332.1 MAG: toxin HipA [candidate division WOR-1 bacterium RIFOXYC2_FULL_37_10]